MYSKVKSRCKHSHVLFTSVGVGPQRFESRLLFCTVLMPMGLNINLVVVLTDYHSECIYPSRHVVEVPMFVPELSSHFQKLLRYESAAWGLACFGT